MRRWQGGKSEFREAKSFMKSLAAEESPSERAATATGFRPPPTNISTPESFQQRLFPCPPAPNLREINKRDADRRGKERGRGSKVPEGGQGKERRLG